ncbi:DNM3B methyltransferase, partial [Psilopogon haemacephalus]|nr:DNM3B methyltransferase [Psilopogon haemacephalus]
LQDGKDFGIGELVWGKIKGFSWWPAIVVSHRATAKRQAATGMRWVQWFGDGKFSEVSSCLCIPLPGSPCCLCIPLPGTPLLPLLQAGCSLPAWPTLLPLLSWQVARSRSGKTFAASPGDSLEEQLRPMVDWALTGFKPTGFKGLRPPKGSVLWGAAGAGGLSPGSHFGLAENGALRNGTEEVLSLEQCPPTKRLKTNLCGSSKEQRLEEDQTRGGSAVLGEAEQSSLCHTDSCLSCGRRNPATFHPLFEGGLCQTCR